MWWRRKPGEHRRNDGFALIEVLVTAAVAAVLLAALMRAFSSVWSGIGGVREETEAMLVARAAIDASTPRMNLVPITQEGMSGRYAWSISIANTGIQSVAAVQQGQNPPTPPNATGQATGQSVPGRQTAEGDQDEETNREPPWSLFRIAVAVRAPSGRRTSLETFRLSRPAAR
ncbi:MAG: prepilin-type N-terminal cleavage/methylation domain-containing protein [Rhizobiales bacterium]|nr:prepilin-type N-terminal cleavage/methylation domain-containing protein [Hyphomicrobiales bacterium]